MLSQEFYETDLRRGFVRGYDMQISNVGGAPLQIALGGLVGQQVSWGEGHHRDFGERFRHQMGIVIMTRRPARRAQPRHPRPNPHRRRRHPRAQD